MKTLTRLVIPATLLALLAAPAAFADHDRNGYRDNRDRYHDYRDDDRRGFRYDVRRERDVYFSRDTRRHLAEYERDRRKRLAEAARHTRKHHVGRGLGHYKHSHNDRHDHRYTGNTRTYYNRPVVRHHRHDHDGDINWAIVLDVAYGL